MLFPSSSPKILFGFSGIDILKLSDIFFLKEQLIDSFLSEGKIQLIFSGLSLNFISKSNGISLFNS